MTLDYVVVKEEGKRYHKLPDWQTSVGHFLVCLEDCFMLVGSHHSAAVYLPTHALQIFQTLRFWIDVEV